MDSELCIECKEPLCRIWAIMDIGTDFLQGWDINILQNQLTGDASLSLRNIHSFCHSVCEKNRWPPGVIAQSLHRFVSNFKSRDSPGAIKWQNSPLPRLDVSDMIALFYFICWAVSISHLQCCVKGMSSSTKGSKSCRWDIIYWTVSCRSRRWPREWPSNWSPRALNRQFLQEAKTVTGMSLNDYREFSLLRFLAKTLIYVNDKDLYATMHSLKWVLVGWIL